MHFAEMRPGGVRRFASTMLVLALGLVLPSSTCAGSGVWPLEVPARVTVAFGATYQKPDGVTATHSGVDLSVGAGAVVLSPVAGAVRFAGAVPATDSSGTQLAVTVESEEGLRITLMPLEAAQVKVGSTVRAGTALGAVASHGDGSSTSTHLHVGARRGELYVDPLEFLGAAPAAGGDGSEGDSAGEGVADNIGLSGDAPVGAGTAAVVVAPTSGAGAPRTQPVRRPTSSSARAPGTSSAPDTAPTLVAGEASVQRTASGTRVDTARSTSRVVSALGDGAPAWQPGKGVEAADTGSAVPLAAQGCSPLADMLASVVSRGVPSALGSLDRLLRAWSVAAIALLAAAGALWPLWRRTPSVGEPCPRVAPVGSEIAAAAGR